MGTPLPSRAEQTAEIVERLEAAYPESAISLRYADRFELLVAVVLSAQCTDERVNKVTAELFEKYPSIEAFATADVEDIAEDINSITYFNSKAGYIHDSANAILEEFDGEVPDTMSELTDLPGVGRKTANVVLQHGHDIVEGIVVDTHVMRLSQRLGVTESSTPEAIERDLMELVEDGHWQEFTHLCIDHGRAVCSARNPTCSECVLEDICPSSKLDHDVDLAKDEPW